MDIIKLAIVDDHKFFRLGVLFAFEQYAHLRIVVEATHGQDFLDKVEQAEEKPDVVLMDLDMPVMDGMLATEKIKKAHPQIKVIILSMHTEEKLILKMLDLGASSYLFKETEPKELALAVETVMLKDYYFNAQVSKLLLKNLHERKNYTKVSLQNHDTITPRELQILTMICEGYSSAEIGERICINKRTVEFHRQNLLEKCNVKNTARLIVYAIQHDLVKL